MAKCMLCGKAPSAANNVPHSVHKTKRVMRPNIQSVQGVKMCTRCLRTIKKQTAEMSAVRAEKTVDPAA